MTKSPRPTSSVFVLQTLEVTKTQEQGNQNGHVCRSVCSQLVSKLPNKLKYKAADKDFLKQKSLIEIKVPEDT